MDALADCRIINGFSIATLNNIIYESTVALEGNTVTDRIDCEYRTAENIEPVDGNSLAIMSFNIRSMKSNFHRFQAEILHHMNLDIIHCVRNY